MITAIDKIYLDNLESSLVIPDPYDSTEQELKMLSIVGKLIDHRDNCLVTDKLCRELIELNMLAVKIHKVPIYLKDMVHATKDYYLFSIVEHILNPSINRYSKIINNILDYRGLICG